LIRYIIVRVTSSKCGEIIYIGPYVEIKEMSNITFGSNVSIHRFCYIDAAGLVEINSNVSIGHGTSIVTSNHTWSDQSLPIRDNPVRLAPVRIEEDVWIGCGCRIMAGVTIARRSVVAAGAVVTTDVASNTLVGGVPARFIKHLNGEKTESAFRP
jgi:acetyltransferase-like isoleucine patch superfamily enzyme